MSNKTSVSMMSLPPFVDGNITSNVGHAEDASASGLHDAALVGKKWSGSSGRGMPGSTVGKVAIVRSRLLRVLGLVN